MNWRNGTARYGSLTIGLHWFMLVLLAAVYACIELHEFFPKGSDPREALKTWHFMLGLSVLALVALRLVAHMSGPVPRIEPDPPTWQKLHGTARRKFPVRILRTARANSRYLREYRADRWKASRAKMSWLFCCGGPRL